MISRCRPSDFLKALKLLPVALAVSACVTFNVPIDSETPMDRPDGVTSVPVAIGVFYDSSFSSYVHNEGALAGHKFAFPIGKASVDYFDQVFAAMFEQVKVVDQRPPLGTDDPEVFAVIEPRLEHFGYNIRPMSFGPFTADVTYRLILHSRKGATIASWTVSGTDTNSMVFGDDIGFHGERAEAAMRDAMVKFMKGLGDVPEVQRWLEQIGTARGKSN